MGAVGAGEVEHSSTARSVADPVAPLVVCVTKFEPNCPWRWFEAGYAGRVRWEFHQTLEAAWYDRLLPRPNSRVYRSCWTAVRSAERQKARLIVAHDPLVAMYCALFLMWTRSRIPLVAWSFNFVTLPRGGLRRVMRWAFRRVDRFIVFSSMERTLYHRVFGIPEENIDLQLWCLGEQVYEPDTPLEPGDYICAVGGNARDYPTLMNAMQRLPDIPMVIVVRPENLQGLTLPPNVRARVNIPNAQANNILKFSRFMVLPLAGREVPCGHVTLVCAMMLGKAFVITDSTGVQDYGIDDQNCVTVEARNADALAEQILALWNDRTRCDRLGAGGRAFAERFCLESNMREHLDLVLRHYAIVR